MEFDGDKVKSLVEKPTYTYYSNAGIYLIKKSVLQHLEYGKHCDATDLMQRLIDKGDKVTSFPIVGYWIDIGRHEDYKKAQEFIKYVKR
jgi:NDP-sugar pyrophosphorylase family protein